MSKELFLFLFFIAQACRNTGGTVKAFKIIIMMSILMTGFAKAGDAPWGSATILETEYKPQKVVYDVSVNHVAGVTSVLDRASYLSTITGADPFESSIVLVLHGKEINFFASKNYQKYRELMHRAQSLVEGEVLKIRMCQIAARSHGFEPDDIHGFVEMIPMGDAEIIRLQNEEGHAYMR